MHVSLYCHYYFSRRLQLLSRDHRCGQMDGKKPYLRLDPILYGNAMMTSLFFFYFFFVFYYLCSHLFCCVGEKNLREAQGKLISHFTVFGFSRELWESLLKSIIEALTDLKIIDK